MVVRKRLDVAIPGVAFVTTSVRGWIPVFQSEEAAGVVTAYLSESVARGDFAVLGYVVMPTHFHGFLGLEDIRRLSPIMKSFKSITSRRIGAIDLGSMSNLFRAGEEFHLWMPRFDDLIIYSEQKFRVKLNYIHQNPVRAGLVIDECAFRYSSAGDWLQDRPGLVPISKDFSWME